MMPCKRIEIVVEQTLANRLAETLDMLGVSGYTLIGNASGSGDRGMRRADEPTGTMTNCIFIIASDDDILTERIVEHIRPILGTSGGMCLVSNAHWVRH
jgi:nitrogen regulatory protein PII